jgi:hypothetical protein
MPCPIVSESMLEVNPDTGKFKPRGSREKSHTCAEPFGNHILSPEPRAPREMSPSGISTTRAGQCLWCVLLKDGRIIHNMSLSKATHGLPQRCQVDPPHVSSGQSIHLGSQTCHDRDNSSTLASSEKDQNISRWRSSGKGASSMSD